MAHLPYDFATNAMEHEATIFEAMRSWIYCVLAMWALVYAVSCANPVAPGGGARDTTPPQLDSLASTPNLSVNFDADEIVLAFDEWVTIKDATKQVLVSPPLAKPLKLTQKRKRIVIDLSDEELRKNTTYTIQFGEAIQDITEGNAFTSTFVFSTGPYLDSLELNGSATLARTGARMAEAFILLHEDLSDTAFQKKRPFYFTKTDKNGGFQFQNLKGGNYKIYGLVDQNVNYLYDLDSETIAFLNEPIDLNDSINRFINLNFFEPKQQPKLLSSKQKTYGTVLLSFNQADYTYSIRPIGDVQVFRTIQEGSDLTLWYDNKPQKETLEFEVSFEGGVIDTFSVSNSSTSRNEHIAALEPLGFKKVESTGGGFSNLRASTDIEFKPTLFHIDSVIVFEFSRPIAELKTEFIVLKRDSNTFVLNQALVESSRAQTIRLSGQKLTPGSVEYQFLPGALVDIFGLSNTDTLRKSVSYSKADDFGNIVINLEMMNPQKAYILDIETQTGSRIYRKVLPKSSKYTTTIKAIEPGKYRIKLIEDTNENGQWDTGEYPSILPEKITFGSIGTLRANWDLELKLVVDLVSGGSPLK